MSSGDLHGALTVVLQQVGRELTAKGLAATEELRTAALEVLRGQRSGRTYRVPGTKQRTYTASAPGEPPAMRTGALRTSWLPKLHVTDRLLDAGTLTVAPGIESRTPYLKYLDGEGFGAPVRPRPKLARRPVADPIKARAWPRIQALFR